MQTDLEKKMYNNYKSTVKSFMRIIETENVLVLPLPMCYPKCTSLPQYSLLLLKQPKTQGLWIFVLHPSHKMLYRSEIKVAIEKITMENTKYHKSS